MMTFDIYLRCTACGWCHAAVLSDREVGGSDCFRCHGRYFTAIDAAEIPHGLTVQALTWPLPEEVPDESNEFGRYTLDYVPTGEDELYADILALVEQSCGTKDDKLDSWAISAYERAIETLVGAGFATFDGEGRICATLSLRARKFEAWMRFHDRKKRVRKARHRLHTIPGLTAEQLATAHDITVAELLAEAVEIDTTKT